MKNKKKVLIPIIVIISLFLIYNIAWGINCYRYRKYEKLTGYDQQHHLCRAVKDDYTFAVFRPDYLSFTGNLSVSQNREYKSGQKENDAISMIIWPCVTGGFEVGISIIHEDLSETEETHRSDVTSVDLEFDKKGNLLPEYAHLTKVYEANKDKIDYIYSLAEKEWGITLPH